MKEGEDDGGRGAGVRDILAIEVPFRSAEGAILIPDGGLAVGSAVFEGHLDAFRAVAVVPFVGASAGVFALLDFRSKAGGAEEGLLPRAGACLGVDKAAVTGGDDDGFERQAGRVVGVVLIVGVLDVGAEEIGSGRLISPNELIDRVALVDASEDEVLPDPGGITQDLDVADNVGGTGDAEAPSDAREDEDQEQKDGEPAPAAGTGEVFGRGCGRDLVGLGGFGHRFSLRRLTHRFISQRRALVLQEKEAGRAGGDPRKNSRFLG